MAHKGIPMRTRHCSIAFVQRRDDGFERIPPLRESRAGKFLLLAERGDLIRLYGLMWVGAGLMDPRFPDMIDSVKHRELIGHLSAVGEEIGHEAAVLGGGLLFYDKDERTIKAGGRSSSFGSAPASMVRAALSDLDPFHKITVSGCDIPDPVEESAIEWFAAHPLSGIEGKLRIQR